MHSTDDELIEAHIADFPETRPFCWWVSIAPAPRECGGLPPSHVGPVWLWRMHLGRPFEFYTMAVGTVLFLESEAHYLRRLNLLEPTERHRLRLMAYEPEIITIADDDLNEEEENT